MSNTTKTLRDTADEALAKKAARRARQDDATAGILDTADLDLSPGATAPDAPGGAGEGAGKPEAMIFTDAAETAATDTAGEATAGEAEAADAAAIEGEAIEGAAIGPDGFEGVRVDQALTMPLLLPVARAEAIDWIMRNVVGRGRGTHVKVGRIYGIAVRATTKETEHQGKKLASIMLTGTFGMESALSGHTYEHADLYLPNGYARQIEAALALGAEKVEFDVDVGIEATGRTIPYAWTVIAYLRASNASPAFARLAARRRVPVAGLLN
jgi:hypothetical protein